MGDKDLWTDHPAQQTDAEPAPTAPTPIKSPEEATSPEEVTSPGILGKGLDGRSRRKRDRPNYKCYSGDRQIPPGVRWLSVKRVCYRKIMSMRRQWGDEMLMRAEIDVPSVESLMASPLSKFIHFAANDCGYSGPRYELIAS